MKKDPPTIEPAPRPGPDYDPLDLLVQDLENIESFLDYIDDTRDLEYVKTHLPKILRQRLSMEQQLRFLSEDPYNYLESHLNLLKKEIEQLFIYLEGAVGSLNDPKEFKKCLLACNQIISRFDNHLTP